MNKEKLPSNGKSYAIGIAASITILILVSVLVSSLYRQTAQIMDTFDTISEPAEEIFSIDYGDEDRGTHLNEAGIEIANRTCLLTDWGWIGSGFLLYPDLLVTAYHVIEGWEELPIPIYCPCNTDPYEMLMGFVVAVAPEFDTAIVQVQFALPADAPAMHWSFDVMSPLTPLHIFGYEKDYQYDLADVVGRHHATSYVANTTMTHEAMEEAEVLAVAGQAVPGNSGGPVFNDDGEIVGMAIALWYSHNVTLVVPASTIHSVLVINDLLPVANEQTR